MTNSNETKTIAMGLVGAAIGGALGWFAFAWLYSQGFYALIAPPALLGLGAGVLAQGRSQTLGVICGFAGGLLALATEWYFCPFKADSSLPYFIMHIHKLQALTWILVVLGVFFSYRFALGRDSLASTRPSS